MRILSLLLCTVPTFTFAEDIALTSRVTAATLYPEGGLITRSVPFEIAAGSHDLILPDLPQGIEPENLRIAVDGATLGAFTLRSDFVPPTDLEKSDAMIAAEDVIEAIEDDIQDAKDRAGDVRLIADSAKARIAFLEAIHESEDLASAGVDTLRDLVAMVGEETLSARQMASAARREIRDIDDKISDLQDDLADAQQALDALVPENKENQQLTVSVSAAHATTGELTITYLDTYNTAWRPQYDMHLTRGDDPTMLVKRSAFIGQSTGENWQDVAITLSTVAPNNRTEPRDPYVRRYFIQEQVEVRPTVSSRSDLSVLAAPVVEMEPVVIYEDTARANFDGPAVTYTFATPLSLASAADVVRISMDEITLDADIRARAVPSNDQTAFMMAHFTNTSGERILPSDASFYVDGAFVGINGINNIAAGQDAELSFGPIEGLRLTHTILDQSDGDRGIISVSNERNVQTLLEIENLTGEPWETRIMGSVPYSEQEDLVIDWTAGPRVSEENVDGARGILAWDMTIDAGTKQSIRLDHVVSWPEGWELR